MKDPSLQGKVAVITGAGRGIGKAIAIAMAREGAQVVVNALNQSSGNADTTTQVIIRLGGQAAPYYGDVSDFEQAGRLIQTALEHFGRLDILVNNAGISGGKRMPWEMSEEEWDRMIRVHLKGTFNCTRHVCQKMKDQRWGRIINCTSGSWISRSGGCHYAAAKAGIVGFTRAVAMDMGDYEVTCNAYHPFAKTDMLGDQMASLVEKRFKLGKIDREEYEWQSNPPDPEGVGPFVAFLASEAAGNINGKIFYVSGGKISLYSEPERKKTILKKEGLWSVEELKVHIPELLR